MPPYPGSGVGLDRGPRGDLALDTLVPLFDRAVDLVGLGLEVVGRGDHADDLGDLEVFILLALYLGLRREARGKGERAKGMWRRAWARARGRRGGATKGDTRR